jgi:GNAT superfamily N-acetyltransferase
VRPVGLTTRDMGEADVPAVVAVHMEAMSSFFLTSLGSRFLCCYYTLLARDDEAIATVSVLSDGTLVGFAVGSSNPNGFYSRLLKRHWLRFALAATGAVMRDARIVPRLWRALAYPGSQPVGETVAGLYSIAVSTPMQGRGVGRCLLDAFLGRAFERGATSAYLHADATGNDGWNALLRRCGWVVTRRFSTPEGRQMNEYWIDIGVDSE